MNYFLLNFLLSFKNPRKCNILIYTIKMMRCNLLLRAPKFHLKLPFLRWLACLCLWDPSESWRIHATFSSKVNFWIRFCGSANGRIFSYFTDRIIVIIIRSDYNFHVFGNTSWFSFSVAGTASAIVRKWHAIVDVTWLCESSVCERTVFVSFRILYNYSFHFS